MKDSEFSSADIIPTEEVASGMHTPTGEMMYAIPNKADDDEIEEDEGMNKSALGLTSVPQSLYGGNVLDPHGSPEPPGLSREYGDDEETDLFGASEEGVDFPPEHYKEQAEINTNNQISEDMDFFDFLYSKNQNRNLSEEIMKKQLQDLELGLKKIKAVDKNFSFTKFSQDVGPNDPEILKKEVIRAIFTLTEFVNKNVIHKMPIADEVLHSKYTNSVFRRIFVSYDGKPIVTQGLSADLDAIFASLFSRAPGAYLTDLDRYNENKMPEYSAIKAEIIRAAELYNKSLPVEPVEPAVKLTPWQEYVKKGGDSRIEAAWKKYVDVNYSNSSAAERFTPSFYSWVKWYKLMVMATTKGYLSPEQVLEKLKEGSEGQIPVEATAAERSAIRIKSAKAFDPSESGQFYSDLDEFKTKAKNIVLNHTNKRITDFSQFNLAINRRIMSAGNEEYEANKISDVDKLSQNLIAIFNSYFATRQFAAQYGPLIVPDRIALKDLADKVQIAAIAYNNKVQSGEADSAAKSERQISPAAKPAEVPVAPRSSSSGTWESYANNGGDVKIEPAWKAWVSANADKEYDESFMSWVKWYNEQLNTLNKNYLSPANTLDLLKVNSTPAAPVAAPTAPPSSNIETAEQTMTTFFNSLASKPKSAKVKGALGIRNSKILRRIKRLGGIAPTIKALYKYRGGGNVEAGKEAYAKLNAVPGDTTNVREQKNKTVSTQQMSELLRTAISDLLSLKVSDRTTEAERRYDLLLKIAQEVSSS